MTDLLRSTWHEPRPPGAPRWPRRDWVLVAVLLAATVLEGLLRPDLPWRVLSVVVVAALVPTLLWRRTQPLLMLVLVFGASAVIEVLTDGVAPASYAMAYLLILPYSLVRWGSGREIVLGAAVVSGKLALTGFLGHTSAGDLFGGVVVLFASFALAAAFRYRAGARRREFDQIKLLERERLARDLHDTVAHHVSAMAIRAQAGLAIMESRPEAAAEALRLIEAEAAAALDEMRAMVHVLRRDQPAELAPGQGLADLPKLASTSRPAVDVVISAEIGDVSPSVGSALYRLAQESVTNARKHARHATRIEVTVAADDTAVHLRVSDDGDGGPARTAPGYGLLGMIERADLLGGSCEAGPEPGRGWTVRASLPRAGAPA
ncbi:Signal transduction histidine kinase [Amycolatopsis xylanica]|uniref:histidine kinase n=1 Tax=Amycolatopsis xylanica TaxID=589385 RepID=A0A1H3JB67_9PSEU|nr:sensor histidine kinase [Amycolatopsis xylanica]SDY36829.1 Signal transduction histidine kinase [Amycolatopsis xylanica]